MDTLQDLSRKLSGAKDIKSVVRAMKAMAASNIAQYETAVISLKGYYHTLSLGIAAYLIRLKFHGIVEEEKSQKKEEKSFCAIIFGSDQGLVGRFNNLMAGFAIQTLHTLQGKKDIWVIGERVQLLLADEGLTAAKTFPVPNSIEAVTPLVGQILIEIERSIEKEPDLVFFIFNNRPDPAGAGYEPVSQRLLPLDEKWQHEFSEIQWPSKNIPQIVGNTNDAIRAFISAYLFVSLFKACAESLASENASRLEAMQRADKNIGDLLDSLGHKFHRLRQSSIDEELFDVVSGFEALNAKPAK